MANRTYRLPSGARVRCGSQRAYVLISEGYPGEGRVEKRSDSREKLLKARRAPHPDVRWFIGHQPSGELVEVTRP